MLLTMMMKIICEIKEKRAISNPSIQAHSVCVCVCMQGRRIYTNIPYGF